MRIGRMVCDLKFLCKKFFNFLAAVEIDTGDFSGLPLHRFSGLSACNNYQLWRQFLYLV